MRIAILGAGAMGCLLGSYLIRGGAQVNLVGRGQAHIDAIREHGLEIYLEREQETVVVHPEMATADSSEVGECDIVLVLTKGPATEKALTQHKALFGASTIGIALQNGLGNEETLARHIGRENTGFGLLKCSASRTAPGHVFGNRQFDGAEAGMFFYLMEPREETVARCRELQEIFAKSGFTACFTERTTEEVWDKLAANIVGNIPCALLQIAPQDFVTNEWGSQLHRGLVRELCAVATAEGVPMEFESYWQEKCVPMIPQGQDYVRTYTSAIQDVFAKQPTEVDYLNGAISERGRRYGIPTPYNDAIVCLMKTLEAHYEHQFSGYRAST